MKKLFFIFVAVIFLSSNISAWVYPEHRDILLYAIKTLNPDYRSLIDKLWSQARSNFEYRLTPTIIDETGTITPDRIDYAAWSGIAGDHSVSAKDMLRIILKTDWILDVAEITANLKRDLLYATQRDDKVNALRNSDIRLQKADPEYVSRAGHNNVHFLLSLAKHNENPYDYIDTCIKVGTELNALGVYIWYHYSALQKMSLYNSQSYSDLEKNRLLISALADEAFAIHFLEDIFASGHVAGTWGSASQKKGTHDYYNEHGIKTSTWEGKSIILTGDAWMRENDMKKAAAVIQLSLIQLLDCAAGKLNVPIYDDESSAFDPEDFNISKIDYMPPRHSDISLNKLFYPILLKTPIPGLVNGLGEFPRFRAELGTFFGFAPSFHFSVLNGGYVKNQNFVGAVAGLETSFRFGVGLDGILNESSDALVFLDFGWRLDGSSSNSIIDVSDASAVGRIFAAIPGRTAITFRLRVPFYAVPGDLLIAAPFLLLFAPKELEKMAVVAGNGGILPWQSGISTSIGRFQFILGREAAVYLFGRSKYRDNLFAVNNKTGALQLLSFRSTLLELPFLEYRPDRSFSQNQSSTLIVQLYWGIDFIHNIELIEPKNVTVPEMKNIYLIGTKVLFDWRHYFQ